MQMLSTLKMRGIPSGLCYPNIFAYAFLSLSDLLFLLTSKSFRLFITPASFGTDFNASFRSFSAPSSSLVKIFPWALR